MGFGGCFTDPLPMFKGLSEVMMTDRENSGSVGIGKKWKV